jgi:hypothetical protein
MLRIKVKSRCKEIDHCPSHYSLVSRYFPSAWLPPSMHGLKNLAILLITIPGVTRGHVATSPTYDRKGRGVDHDNETEDAQ